MKLFYLMFLVLPCVTNVFAQQNTVLGVNATSPGYNATPGYRNVTAGYESGLNITNGSTTIGFGNSFVGYRSGRDNTDGEGNCFFGYQTGLVNTIGNQNSFFGRSAGAGNVDGSFNTYVGYAAGYQGTGNNNTYLGYRSGWGNPGGSGNVFIGNNAGSSITGGPANNRLMIDNSSTSLPLIYGEFDNGNLTFNVDNAPSSRLTIKSGVNNNSNNGTSGLKFANLTSSSNTIASNGKVLTVNASGDVVLTTDVGSGATTQIQGGTNVTVTGSGVVGNPYIISSTASNCNLYTCDGTLTSNRLVNMNNKYLIFNTGGNTTTTGGRIYIGNTNQFTTGTGGNFVTFSDIDPANVRDYRLYVEGGVLSERVKVALRNTGNWADYVFSDNYKLMSLPELEEFIKENNHLPGIDSAADLVKKGLDLAQMQAKQMEKIEELTLYTIEQNKAIEKQAKEIEELKLQVKALLERK